MKKVLLTGGTGYVGPYVLKELLKKKYKVTCLVNDNSSLPSKVEIVRGDILDKKAVSRAVKGQDAIIHLAAAVRIKDPKINYDINVVGTKNVVEACKKYGVKRIIYTSTVSALRKKVGPYGKTKKKAGEYLKKSSMNYTIFYPPLIYGKEGQGTKNILTYIQAFPLIIPLIGSGKYTRQPVWVEDVASVVVGSLGNKKTYRKDYPLAGKNIITFRDLTKHIAKELGVRKIFLPIPLFVCTMAAWVFEHTMSKPLFTREHIRSLSEDTRFDIGELIQDTGFSPIELADGLRKVVKKL